MRISDWSSDVCSSDLLFHPLPAGRMFRSIMRPDRIAARMPLPLLRPILVALVMVTAAGCSSTDETPYVDRPVEQIYNEAYDAALKGQFKKAAPLFDEVERQHPYSIWATQAQLMAAYSIGRAHV